MRLTVIHSFISIHRYRPDWQEPEPSHVTGMAVAHRILGKFLGVVCHCFPPPLDVPSFAARCLYVRNDARDPSSERWNCGREVYELMWKNIVERGRPQMAIWRMRVACWITKLQIQTQNI